MFARVDESIQRCGTGPSHLEQAFSEVHDGALYRHEIDGLVRKRMLRIIPISEPPGPREWDSGLMGYLFTVDMTDRTMRWFWPALFAKRVTAQEATSTGPWNSRAGSSRAPSPSTAPSSQRRDSAATGRGPIT